MSVLSNWLRGLANWRFSTSTYPFPPGSQNRDGFERNADNPLWCTASEELVMRLSAVWACVRLLAETISSLPVNIYERQADGSKVLRPEHELYGLLHMMPNADMTAQTFFEAYLASMLLRGDGWAEQKRVGRRRVAIDFLDPRRFHRTRNADGSWTNRYTEVNGETRIIPDGDLWHTLGFSTDGICGLSAVQYGSGIFRQALSADTAAQSTFDRGLLPTVGFKMQNVLQKTQREEFRENFSKSVAGAMNAGKPFLMEGGMEAVSIGIKPQDAQLLESRAWSIEEICRWFRVPPFMVGHAEKSTTWGTGIEQQMIGFLTFSLRPWLTRIEQSISKDLLRPEERGRIFAQFEVEGLLRADSAARAAYLTAMTDHGLMTRDEARAYDNRAPMGGNAAKLTVQSNLVPIDQLGETAAKPAGGLQDALKNFLDLTGTKS